MGGYGMFTFVDLPFASFDTWRMFVVYVIVQLGMFLYISSPEEGEQRNTSEVEVENENDKQPYFDKSHYILWVKEEEEEVRSKSEAIKTDRSSKGRLVSFISNSFAV